MDETTQKTGQEQPVPAPAAIETLEALYLTHYTALRDSIFQARPGLSFLEVDAILNRLSNRLHRFQGTAADFPLWAARYCKLWARHQAVYLSLVTDTANVRAIQSAIRRTVHADYEDCAVEPSEDIFSEICLYLYSHSNGFLSKKQDTAKISTRLYALAARHCEFYHNANRYRRFNIVAENVTTLGVAGTEFLSKLELASMRAEEPEELAAD